MSRSGLHFSNVSFSTTSLRIFLVLISALAIAYGSLLPLNFQLPGEKDFYSEIDRLKHPWSMTFSTSDFIINFLLYFMLGMCCGLLPRNFSASKIPSAGLFCIRLLTFSCLFFSFCTALELLQIFLPSRYCSLSDTIANTIGASIGFLVTTLALAVIAPAIRLASDWAMRSQRAIRAIRSFRCFYLLNKQNLSYISLGFLTFYFWLLLQRYLTPFHPAVDLSNLAGRLSELRQLPFSFLQSKSYLPALAGIGSDVIFFFPLGILLGAQAWLSSTNRRQLRRKTARALFILTTVAIVLEVGQLALPARVGDISDSIVYLIGGALGLVSFFSFSTAASNRSRAIPRPALPRLKSTRKVN